MLLCLVAPALISADAIESFQEDDIGIRLRDVIGVDSLMWGSDYPHSESTFPKSREILDSILEGVPKEEKALIAGENCAKLFRVD